MRNGFHTDSTSMDVAGGLCVTCGKRSACMHLKGAEGPFLQCEEYDDGEVARPATAHRDAQAWLQAQEAPTESGADLVGLCRTCENRATCMHLERSGFGVWQCEDWR